MGRSTKWFTITIYALTLLVFCCVMRATTTATISAVTNTQAVIRVISDQPGSCSYRISETQDLSVPVNDVNPLLFPGADSDARATSLVSANERSFVVGVRRADQGTDGKWYSRALAANTVHFGLAKCGSDAPAAFSFTTLTIAAGSTYGEPLPFDSHALGNYAIPSFDLADLSKSYVDPQTGFKFKLLTGPGQLPESAQTFSNSSGNGQIRGAAGGSNWISPMNGLTADSSFATYSAAMQEILVLRLPGQCPFGECGPMNWQGSVGNCGGYHCTNIDTYQLALTGNGNGSAVEVDAALSWNGVTQGSEWHTITLPPSTGTITYPPTLFGGLAAWQGVNYPNIPGMYWHAVQRSTTVSTNGTTVTYTGPPDAAPFVLDARILTGGSKITISGVEYTIASVDSATQLTLSSSAGVQNSVKAYIANFSVMIRKHKAAPGTVNIDGIAVTVPFSNSFSNGGSGFQQSCSHLTTTDSKGNVGRFCMFRSHQGDGGLFWITNDLDVRFIGRTHLPASSLGITADEYNATSYFSTALFDTTDANSWWIATTLTANGGTTLVKATYTASGVSGCSQTGNYHVLAPDATYSPGSVDNCNIIYSELTRPSQNKDLWTAINKIQPMTKSGRFSPPVLSFIQNGYAVFTVNAGGQDTDSWIFTLRLSDAVVKGVYSTYMNGKGSCRACVLHGMGPSNPTDDWFFLVFNNYPEHSYQVRVNTALPSVPALDKTTCAAQVTDPAVAWLIPYSDGCDTIMLAGFDNIPCTAAPTPWDTANQPLCTWNGGGWTQWQAGAAKIGDWLKDPVTQNELMVLGKNVTGTTWILIRNVNPPQGPSMVPVPGVNPSYLRNHPAGWEADLYCTFHQNAIARISTETDGSGLIWDRKFVGFNHSVLRSNGFISAEFFADINSYGQSVRMGSYPTAANQPETYRLFNSAPFSGKLGTSFFQQHPAWDGVNPWFTDMSPFAPGAGGSFSLWPQPGVTPAASGPPLYKIPASSMNIANDKRRRAIAAWSGMYNFKDVSGATISNSAADNFKYCSIDYAGATCGQPGEQVGDVFINIPQASIDGSTGGAYDLNHVNVTTLSQEPLGVLQYYFNKLGSNNVENLGRWERRITTGFGRYNGQDTYSNAKTIWNSNILLFNCGTPNLQRIGDLCIGFMPPDSFDSVVRYDFIPVPITLPAGPAYAEVQFGYAENGAPGQFYCTTRQEACNTSSPAGTPFNWERETRRLTPCSSGCTIQVSALPDHILYFSVRRSSDGINWVNGPIQVSDTRTPVTSVSATGKPPTADSVTGLISNSLNQALTLKYSSTSGYTYLSRTSVLLKAQRAVNSCYVYYDKATDGFYLYGDGAARPLGPLTPGSSLHNNQCTLNAIGTTVSGSGSTLTMTVNLSLSPALGGPVLVYMEAEDRGGLSSGWQSK